MFSQNEDLAARFGLLEQGRGYLLSDPISVEVVEEVRGEADQPLDSLTAGCANPTAMILIPFVSTNNVTLCNI